MCARHDLCVLAGVRGRGARLLAPDDFEHFRPPAGKLGHERAAARNCEPERVCVLPREQARAQKRVRRLPRCGRARGFFSEDAYRRASNGRAPPFAFSRIETSLVSSGSSPSRRCAGCAGGGGASSLSSSPVDTATRWHAGVTLLRKRLNATCERDAACPISTG